MLIVSFCYLKLTAIFSHLLASVSEHFDVSHIKLPMAGGTEFQGRATMEVSILKLREKCREFQF